MEAWILHIKIEAPGDADPAKTHILHNLYSAWMTEKQALVAAGKCIKDTQRFYYVDEILKKSVFLLIDKEEISLAIDLINKYTQTIKRPGQVPSEHRKYTISIVQSTFLGSAFE